MGVRRLFAGIFFACLCCGLSISSASGLQISPVRIHLSKQQGVTSFTVTNSTNKEVVLQGEIKQWRQAGEQELYSASDDLILAPPIVAIPPGKSQIFRVAVRNHKPSDEEQSYRVYLQEVVSQLDKEKAGLHFALRIGLPVFIAPKTSLPKKVKWDVKTKKGEVLLTATNLSNVHVQISHLLLVDKKKNNPIIDKSVFRYLLPGKSYTWHLKTKKKAQEFMDSIKLSKLEAKTDQGVLNSDISIS